MRVYHQIKGEGRIDEICRLLDYMYSDKFTIFVDFGKGPEEVGIDNIRPIYRDKKRFDKEK